MDEITWPAADVLAELGEITWAAMALEYMTGQVCECVIGDSDEVIRESIGRQVIAALEPSDYADKSRTDTLLTSEPLTGSA